MNGMVLGLTFGGRNASIKALHPAADIGPQRWPDKAANNTLVLQNTDVFLLDSRGYTEGWSTQFWLTPFVDCPLIVARRPVGELVHPKDMKTENCITGLSSDKSKMFEFLRSTQWTNDKHPSDQYQTARITARSVTIDLVANSTSNEGVVYAGQFTPNIELMPERGGITEKEVRALFRKMVLEHQSKHQVVALNDDESLESCEASDDEDDPTPAAPDAWKTGYRCVFQDFPQTGQEIIQMDPRSYMARACEGVYMPLRHASDSLEYAETSVESYLSAEFPRQADTNTTGQNVLISKGWTMGAGIFQALNTDASLSVKVISSLELTARPDSEMSKMTEEAPPEDKLAITQTRAAMGKLPSAFPASDNALGTVMNWVADALSSVPIVGGIARGAKSLDKALGGAGTRFLDSIF